MPETGARTVKEIVEEIRQRPGDMAVVVKSLRRDKAYPALAQVYRELGDAPSAAKYDAKQAKIDNTHETEKNEELTRELKNYFKIFATGKFIWWGFRMPRRHVAYHDPASRTYFLNTALHLAEQAGGQALRREVAERAVRVLIKLNDSSLYRAVSTGALQSSAPEAFKALERHFALQEKAKEIKAASSNLRV